MEGIAGELRGDRVKRLRDRLDISQDALGKAIGSDARAIWRYEKGKSKNPDFVVVKALAKHLNTNTDYLLGLSDDDSPELREEDLTADERSILTELRNDPGLRELVVNFIRSRR